PLSLFLAFATPFSLVAKNFSEAEQIGEELGTEALESSEAGIALSDLEAFVSTLASDQFEGRGTGDPGERMATEYFATFLEGLGLQPEGDEATFFQPFEFRAGMELDGENSLTVPGPDGDRKLAPGEGYQPLSISTSDEVDAEVVFVGFGIDHEDYNSFEGLDVEGKWVLALRGNPEGRNEDLRRFAPLVQKARMAKDKGAAGILFVKAENPEVGPELIPPSNSVGSIKEPLPSIVITDELAATLLKAGGSDSEPKTLFDAYNEEERTKGFPLSIRIQAEIGLAEDMDAGRNVLGRLVVGEKPSEEVIIVGGHIDHIGFGYRGGSRAEGYAAEALHPGADDNASGIAAIMEMAQYLTEKTRSGKLELKRDILFAGWSGEEVGLWGSRAFVREAREETDREVYPGVAAYLNLDMVGRASNSGLTLNGTASSSDWQAILDAIPKPEGLTIKRSPSPYIPSDGSSFYLAGVPMLAAFTGLHDDYHTPGDTIDKIDFAGLEQVTKYLSSLVVEIANNPEAPAYVEVPRNRGGGRPLKVTMGIRMEEYNGPGIRITEVVADSPAEKAGFQAGDILRSLNGEDIARVEGLLDELRKLEPDTEYPVVLKRGNEELDVTISLEPR
ncbi:MAG: M28 family peptidase, partial [Verrucomicrobiota bacterium]